MTFAQPFRDYEVLDRIGAGSMGTVFKARHKKLGRNVALKVLKPSLGRDARYVDRLRREARIVASLNHPNIVTGYDLGNEGGYHFFVMEYIQGKSLRELLDEWGMFAEQQVLDVAIQITTALDHAFERGVIHRDIKPGNILIDETNTVKLTDMGLAKGPEDLTLTRAGATVGTPQYISPEQAKDPQAVDVRSDLYSLGATLFHMCTGQPPFRAETMASVLIKVLEERAPSAAGLNPDVSDGLNLIVRKLLSKDPGRRYQSPADLLDDLQRVRRSEPPAVAEEDLDPGQETARRVRLSTGPIAILLLVALLLVVAILPDWSRPAQDLGPDSTFGRAVALELAGLPRVGDRLGHLRQLLATASPEQRAVLQAQQLGIEQDLRNELLGLLAREERALGSTHSELRWVGAARDLELRLETQILETIGIATQVLPTSAGEDYLVGWKRISSLLSQLDANRERVLKHAVDEWGITVGDRLQDDIRTQDFARAQQNLRSGVHNYEGLAGSPALADLPLALREYVEAAKERTRTSGEVELDQAEEKASVAFGQTLGRRVEAILSSVRIDPIAAERELDAMAAEMRQDYPPERFTVGRDPWLVAEPRLKEARVAVRSIATDELDKRFRRALEQAYELAMVGDIETAVWWLEVFARDVSVSEKGPHLELLSDADSVRIRLLRALGPGTRVTTSDGVVEVVESGPTLSLEVSGQQVQLPQLKVAELVEAAGAELGSLTKDEEAGLALWYFLSGEPNEMARLLDDVLADIIDLDLEAPRHEGLDAQRLLVRAGNQLEVGDWQGAAELLATLRRDHSAFAEDQANEFSQMDSVIERGQRRQELSSSLERLRRIGVQVEVDQDLSVRSVYRIAQVEMELPLGWERDSDVLRATSSGGTLRFETGIPVQERVWASVDISFPEESVGSRFVFLKCHGAKLGLGVLADGRLVVKSIQNEADTGRVSREIREALSEVESSPFYVVPGAKHRFEVRVHSKSPGQLSVSVDMDGQEVIKGRSVRVPRQVAARFEISPSHPLAVHRLEFRSVVGGG